MTPPEPQQTIEKMPSIKLHLFGTFQLTLYDQPVNLFRSQRARALLAYLALESARPIARTFLAELLWEHFAPEPRRTYLRVALSNLRQCFHPFQLLHTTYQTVQFDAGNPDFWCDTLELERKVQFAPIHRVRQSQNGTGATPAPTFLEGFETVDSAPFQAWLQERRTHYRHLHSHLAPRPASHTPRRTFAPLASAPAADWEPPAAVLVARTQDETGVDPPPLTAETIDSPARPAPHNLPRRLTALYGRTVAIKQLSELLARDDCSLITLLGEGGIGKTQLALATAWAVRPHFPDGIWLVELAALGAPPDHRDEDETPAGRASGAPAEAMAQHLASVIGEVLAIHYQSPTDRMERLVAYLRTRRMLLILDGFEEHLDYAPALLTLLRNTVHTKALVTSRRPLNLLAEQQSP